MTATTVDRTSARSLGPPPTTSGAETGLEGRTGKVVGVLFIVATAASILGSIVLGSVLDRTDYLVTLADHEAQVVAAALLFLIAATAAFGTAVLLFPILRRHAEAMAAGYLGLRAFENVLYAASVVGLLAMVSVSTSDAFGTADASGVRLVGAALLAVREWSSVIGTLIFSGLGVLVLNAVLYRSRLVPRWVSVWGLIGGAMALLYGVLGVLGVDTGLGSPFMLLAMPLAVQEMVFAGWLLTRKSVG
jgi:Domain of unknown function (DUF4386)